MHTINLSDYIDNLALVLSYKQGNETALILLQQRLSEDDVRGLLTYDEDRLEELIDLLYDRLKETKRGFNHEVRWLD